MNALELADKIISDTYPLGQWASIQQAAAMLRSQAAELAAANTSLKAAALALVERDAEIAGWKADQKENLRNQCALQTEIERLREALKLAEESMGAFISDHGWSQQDMNNFDTVCAALTPKERRNDRQS